MVWCTNILGLLCILVSAIGQCTKEDVLNNTDPASITITPDKNVYDTGETISIECSSGYTRSSGENITWTCLDGVVWSGSAFNCEPRQCTKEDVLNNIDPASITITPDKNVYDTGETISIECSSGYTSSSGENITWTCLDGVVWSGSTFNCEPRQCTKEDVFNNIDPASITITPDKNVYDIGETISIECSSGYTRSSGENITWMCLDGIVWGGSAFNCEPRQCAKEDVLNNTDPASITITPDKNVYGTGETISIECSSGYTRSSGESIMWTCLDGVVWSGSVFNCEPTTTVSESRGDDGLGVSGLAGISAGIALIAISAMIGFLALIWYLRCRRKQSKKTDMELLTKMDEGIKNEAFSDTSSVL